MSDTSDPPLSYAELQKLDDGTYISEVRKNQANAVLRARETADKSWKIAASVAAVILATGFTDKLQAAPPWVRLVGVVAIVLWLSVTGLFLWVNRSPPPGDAVWVRTRKSVEAMMRDELESAKGELVRERETHAKLQTRTALKFISRRFTIATVGGVIALIVSGIALGAAVLAGERDDLTTGRLLLDREGTAAVLGACPNLDQQSLLAADARIDVEKIGVDEPVAVYFAAGVCAGSETIVHLDGELVRGFADR